MFSLLWCCGSTPPNKLDRSGVPHGWGVGAGICLKGAAHVVKVSVVHRTHPDALVEVGLGRVTRARGRGFLLPPQLGRATCRKVLRIKFGAGSHRVRGMGRPRGRRPCPRGCRASCPRGLPQATVPEPGQPHTQPRGSCLPSPPLPFHKPGTVLFVSTGAPLGSPYKVKSLHPWGFWAGQLGLCWSQVLPQP